ncbi:hypothetical protein [Oceanobacillus sp. E9]|uniref:hypothetical protein n=1 Tax=Oceanobacillus sp. E9 TaxID=1742575 RepID=UPI001F0A471B|nr:hypothetical protein [Oceanobacillus sp. E9]
MNANTWWNTSNAIALTHNSSLRSTPGYAGYTTQKAMKMAVVTIAESSKISNPNLCLYDIYAHPFLMQL